MPLLLIYILESVLLATGSTLHVVHPVCRLLVCHVSKRRRSISYHDDLGCRRHVQPLLAAVGSPQAYPPWTYSSTKVAVAPQLVTTTDLLLRVVNIIDKAVEQVPLPQLL